MVPKTIRFLAASVGLLWLTASVGWPAIIECRLLQYQQSRVYFSAGAECDIFPGCSFVALCGADTVCAGCIEKAFLGVSFSYPVDSCLDLPIGDSCLALVEAADRDSLSPIRLGVKGIEPLSLVSRVVGMDTPGMPLQGSGDVLSCSNSAGNTTSIVPYDRYIDLGFKVQLGELDGFFSFENRDGQTGQGRTVETPAPFIAVLVPNLTRAANRHGHLAVSVYYRYDPKRLPVLFAGDRALEQNSLTGETADGARPYPFSPERGRTLFEDISPRPGKIQIGVQSKALDKMALFFADVLSRDRVEVEFCDSLDQSDLFLAFVPVDNHDARVGLNYLRDILHRSTPEYLSQREAVDSIDYYLNRAAEAVDPDSWNGYCLKAERFFVYDLGVLPLFRPRIYFHASELLTGYGFDGGGFFDTGAVAKLRRPTRSPECAP